MRFILLALMLLPTLLFAQTDSMVVVPRSALTANQLAQIQTEETMARYGKFAGMGQEIGIAVNGTLSALTDNTAKFAETKVGKVAMFLIIWRVIGEDLRNLFGALLIGLVGVPAIIWSYRRATAPDTKTVYHENGKVKEVTVTRALRLASDEGTGVFFMHAIPSALILLAFTVLI